MPCIFKNPIRERGKRQNILTYRFAFQPVKLKIALMFGAHNKLPWDYFNKNSGKHKNEAWSLFVPCCGRAPNNIHQIQSQQQLASSHCDLYPSAPSIYSSRVENQRRLETTAAALWRDQPEREAADPSAPVQLSIQHEQLTSPGGHRYVETAVGQTLVASGERI